MPQADVARPQAELSRSDQLRLYRNLLLARKLEEALFRAVASGVVPGFVHSGLGQEAVGVGGCTFLRPDDYLMPTHRGFAHLIGKGLEPRYLMAEVYGRSTGVARGKGGIHFAAYDLGAFGISGTIGGAFPIAVGQGIAAERAGRGQVVACFFGDGAAQRGTLHESMNLASLWQLPIVWVCENNQWGLSLPITRGLAVPNVADLAASYAMPGTIADGNDVLAVHAAVSAAVDAVRAGGGPRLVELKTYRLRGHYEGEPARYRSREEAQAWEARDPLRRHRAHLVDGGIAEAAELETLEAEAEATIRAAERFAEESPAPEPADALEDVYAP